MYDKSKLIQEFCFQLSPYSGRRRKQSVLLKRFLYTGFDKFHLKEVLLKKMFLKSKKYLFLHWLLEIYSKGLIFTPTVIQSFEINVMNHLNILRLASVFRSLVRSFCSIKNNVFFLLSCEHILFKKLGLVEYSLITGCAIKMTNADYEDNTSLL